MDIKNQIQHYIGIYFGCEERVINKTMNDCKCSREAVKANINWLIKEGFYKYVDYSDMTDREKDYFRSDNCNILRKIKWYDDNEYREEKRKEKELEEKLSNIDKFRLFFSKMEKEFKRTYFSNGNTYTLEYGANDVTLLYKDTSNDREVKIDFDTISSLTYNESENYIFYKMDNKYYTMRLYYLWAKCYLQHYESL